MLTINGIERNNIATISQLLQDEYNGKENLVVIVNGFQTNEDLALNDGDNVTIIEKGVFPPKEQLEQMMAARHTPKVHEKVKQARVAIAGLGGLGSNIAVALARTGVGKLLLVDFDVVEPSNLNRQQYRISDLGFPKTTAIGNILQKINPFLQVETVNAKVTAENCTELFSDYDIVVEAFDNAVAKAMLVNTMLTECPKIKVVAASGMAGYGSSNNISTRKISDNFYICGDFETGAKIGCGLMAPRVMLCAAHQANMVLRLTLGETDV